MKVCITVVWIRTLPLLIREKIWHDIIGSVRVILVLSVILDIILLVDDVLRILIEYVTMILMNHMDVSHEF